MSVSHSPETHAPGHHELGFLRKYVFSEDHKVIGIQFFFSGLIFFLIGGLLALMLRTQIAWPTRSIALLGRWFPLSYGDRMSPEFYTMLFSMHATIMIFFVIIPMLTAAFGNFLIPLTLGARTMVLPKLNLISYCSFCPAFIVPPAASWVGAAAAGTGPPPYATRPTTPIPPGKDFQAPIERAPV